MASAMGELPSGMQGFMFMKMLVHIELTWMEVSELDVGAER